MISLAVACYPIATIDPEAKKMMRTAGNTGALGIEIALAVCLGYFGGQFLDGRFHSTPWLKWIGFAAGMGAAVKALVRVTRQYQKTLRDENDPASVAPSSSDAPRSDNDKDKEPPKTP